MDKRYRYDGNACVYLVSLGESGIEKTQWGKEIWVFSNPERGSQQ